MPSIIPDPGRVAHRVNAAAAIKRVIARAELWVEFVSGRRYIYDDVPADVAATFGSAFSRGVYFNSRIRDRFPCREAPPHEPAIES